MLGVLENVLDGLYLFLHQVAEHLVVREVGGDERCGGVCPVSGTESVVDVAVSVGSELFHELLLACLHGLLGLSLLLVCRIGGESSRLAFLLSVETQVLKHQDLTRLEGRSLLVSLLAVVGELDRNAETLRDVSENMLEGELRINSLRTSEVGHKNEGTTLGEHFLECRESRADTGVVCDVEILIERNVEIHSDNCLLTFEVVGVNVLLHNLIILK